MVELQILIDSLNKKKIVLAKIEEENKNQEMILKAEKISFDDFELIVDNKTALIDEINKIDQGFDTVYNRIKDELIANKIKFKGQIETLKTLISDITESSVSIQAQETRNKSLVEKFFSKSREDIKTDRIRAKSSYDFMNRNNIQDIPARFMDTKK